jgi:hypothetical protein
MNSYLRRFVLDSYLDKTLTDVIRKLESVTSESATLAHKISLAQAPLLLPDLVSLLEGVVVQADDHPKIRAYAGGLLTFVYNPLDYIGDDPPAGLVDDVIVCALGLMKLAEEGTVQLDPTVEGVVRSTAGLAEYLKQDLLSAITEFVEELETKVVPSVT